MLGKMIKHEFKSTARLFLPLFVIVVILTPILSLLFRLSTRMWTGNTFISIIGGMSMMGFVVLMIATYVAARLFIAIRFYRTTATSEAYLTFCLPVNNHQILLSKLIVGFIWQVLSGALVLAAIYGMLVISGEYTPGGITNWLISSIPSFANDGSLATRVFVWFLSVLLMLLMNIISDILQAFLAICLGQLFNEHRVIASIGMYVGIYTVMQILSTILLVPAFFITENMESLPVMSSASGDVPYWFFIIFAGMYAVIAVVFYFISAWILKKKTNIR